MPGDDIQVFSIMAGVIARRYEHRYRRGLKTRDKNDLQIECEHFNVDYYEVIDYINLILLKRR